MALTHWRSFDNPDYIGAYAFQPNEEKIVTIMGVRVDTVVDATGRKERKPVAILKETKPLILNSTNRRMIVCLTGSPYVEHWVGRQVVLHVEKIPNNKWKPPMPVEEKTIDAVRVKYEKITPVANIICEDCGKEIAPYGKMTAAGVAEYTFKKFGSRVCMACGQARADAEKPVKEEPHESDS